MKIGSISGLTYRVSDLDKTAAFYEALGFRPGKRDDQQATCYVNWFWLTFTTADDDAGAAIAPGSGPTLYLKVDDIDEAHAAVLAAGFTPSTEPHKVRAGRREFLLLDPDGHRLAFFTK
ncbi:VOC family protein [Micromonospora sp. NPDC049799]|uniref:VOC family protein n=1 Tax=Micromonospora sp. NPDC049799 TaxID=3154741 RepID=UPI0033F4B226